MPFQAGVSWHDRVTHASGTDWRCGCGSRHHDCDRGSPKMWAQGNVKLARTKERRSLHGLAEAHLQHAHPSGLVM